MNGIILTRENLQEDNEEAPWLKLIPPIEQNIKAGMAEERQSIS
jgi:hypothetical protein